MLNIVRTRLAAAGLAGLAMAVVSLAIAQDNSSSTTSNQNGQQNTGQSSSIQTEGVQANAQGQQNAQGQPNAANPSNLPQTESATTKQQANAPVVDPHAAAQDAQGTGAAAQAGGAPNPNTNNNPSEWPAPQRYDASRGPGGNMRSGQGGAGGASLGVNIVGREDGIVVARILPGTPAEQMGLRPRDRIISLNGQPVGSVDEFIAAIRGMNPGDQIQLSVDRSGNTRNLAGKLEAFREAVAAGEGPVGNMVGRARDIIRDRGDRFADNYRGPGESMQTGYDERSQAGRQASSDLEARLTRVEQQLDQIMREMSALRVANKPNEATGAAVPNPSTAAPPSTAGPTAAAPAEGQPPVGAPTPTR